MHKRVVLFSSGKEREILYTSSKIGSIIKLDMTEALRLKLVLVLILVVSEHPIHVEKPGPVLTVADNFQGLR